MSSWLCQTIVTRPEAQLLASVSRCITFTPALSDDSLRVLQKVIYFHFASDFRSQVLMAKSWEPCGADEQHQSQRQLVQVTFSLRPVKRIWKTGQGSVGGAGAIAPLHTVHFFVALQLDFSFPL